MTGLIRARILEESDRERIMSRYHRTIAYAYPIPTLNRDRAWRLLPPALIKQGNYSRGLGAWRYKIGNMDQVMMAVEVVNHVLRGEQENVFQGS